MIMKILVVDDEEMQRDLMKGFLEKQGYDVSTAADGKTALALFSDHPFHLVLLDNRMPDSSGAEVLEGIKTINPLVRSIMITAYGSVNTAVAVMKLGADDFLEKPVDLSALLEKIRSIEKSIMIEAEAASVSETLAAEELPVRMIGESRNMKTVFSLVRRIAPTDWTVLIQGETGTGKELIARILHLLSPRNENPFIEVNCAAIPENLFESEIFGHEKGAFTGAVSSRKGSFELAQKGSLFLDEVGELPMSLQAKLLRALQEKRINRVGSGQPVSIDVRVFAATNRDLKKMVEDGRFREDLFYRLKVLDLEIPPLRHRKEDIAPLTAFFIDRYASGPVRFDPDAMATLIKYSFPGNVRELEHMIQRILTLSRGPVIRTEDLPAEVRFHHANDQGTLAERLEAVEREMVMSALEKHDWVQTRAADSLGISERVLRYKMKKYRIKTSRR